MAEKAGSATDRKVLTLLSNCGHTRGVLVRPDFSPTCAACLCAERTLVSITANATRTEGQTEPCVP